MLNLGLRYEADTNVKNNSGYAKVNPMLFITLVVAGIFKINKREFVGYKTAFYPLTPLFFFR